MPGCQFCSVSVGGKAPVSRLFLIRSVPGEGMIRLSGVSKAYVQNTPVLDRIDLELKRGEFLYVLGGTGTGKTSLLRLLALEERPTAGTVSLFGYDLGKASQRLTTDIRRALGYVPQDLRLLPDLSVFENIALPLWAAPGPKVGGERKSRERVHELLDRAGLLHKRSLPAGKLSGGEAQRIAVGRALAREPDLLLADEPTGAQDPEHIWALMELFVHANRQGTTIALATHDREIVRRVRKRCAVIQGGKLQTENVACSY